MEVRHPTSVYFLSGCRAGTTFEYRVLHKQEQLALHNIQSVVQQRLSYSEETLKEALSHDLIYLYRVAYSPFVEELIQQARGRHIPVIFGIDDLVFDPKVAGQVDPVKKMSPGQAAHYYEGTWRFRQTLLACDYVVAATEYLAELARAHGKPASVHRNGLSQWMVETAEQLTQKRQERPQRDTIVIGYGSGTATHRKDLAEAADSLTDVMARHSNVELHIAGSLQVGEPMALPDNLRSLGERVKHLPQVEWRKWLSLLNTFDINLAPLESGNPFCDAKSEIKYTEAALLGLPTMASRVGAYEFAIRDGENGFLAGDTDEWTIKLEQLINDSGLRSRMGRAARVDVLARYAPKVLGQELVRTLESIQELYTQERAPTLKAAPNPRTTPLILNWLVTEPTPGSGGHTDIIRMINLLTSFGHQINTYILPRQQLSHKSDLEIRDYVRRYFADLNGSLFKWAGDSIVESDAVILTHWTTAYLIDEIRNTSKVFYFVQDWEPFFSPMGADYLRAEQTYKMGFSCITLGRWLTECLRSRYNADADYFDLAVDHSIYYPRSVTKSDQPQICFYARPRTPRRIFPIGVEALGLVHQRRPDVKIVLYGASESALHSYTIPFPYTNAGILNEQKLAELFSASDVGVVFSSTNCSLVPPEMMACKCPVVDLNRDTVRGVLEHEVNALLVEPTPEAIAGGVVRLLEDEPLRRRLVETAYQQVQQLSWEKSARRVEEILYEKLPMSRRALAPHRFQVQPNLPALSDLPSEQREHLNAIHAKRRRLSARWKARAKGWIKRLLQTGRNLGLNGTPIQTLGELAGKRCIGQSFVAQRDDLHRIDVLVSTYSRRNTRDAVFHLKESVSASDDLATVHLNASLLADNSYARFVFEPQLGSRGKSFYFYVESPESVCGDAIALWAYRQVDLPDAKLYQDGGVSNGQLVFGAFYMDGRLGEVSERPSPYKFEWLTTFWHRLKKTCRMLLSNDWATLKLEIARYLAWKIGPA